MAGISPNPACYRVLGRADEIARTANSPHVRAEHLFLAIIHDEGMPAQVLARLADISLLVGPEGGISPAEAGLFAAAGAAGARLGPTVLRASSAGAIAAALVMTAAGRWD